MSYKWKPSASQRKAFAIRMQDPDEQLAYNERKHVKEEKRRAGSKFDYHSAGGMYIPTNEQWKFCMNNMHLFETNEEMDAANQVMYGFSCQEKIHHDYIHIVNEKRRSSF